MKPLPLMIELYAGLHGWGVGGVAQGFRVVGFDILDICALLGKERPQGCHLVIQDVTTLHGSQFKNAAVMVASPPCTEYSYMAMPWTRAKQIAKALRGHGEFPAGYTGSRTIAELNALFDACFRIQREASEAVDRYIPLIVENVRGAQPWVGRAKANFGSYYLWGDVGMVGKRVVAGVPRFGVSVQPMNGRKRNPDGTDHGSGSWFKIADSKNRGAHAKVPGIIFNGEQGKTSPGFNVTAAQRYREGQGTKVSGDWFGNYAEQKAAGTISPGRLYGKNSNSRKAASAQIAEIPYPLARYIASCFREGRE